MGKFVSEFVDFSNIFVNVVREPSCRVHDLKFDGESVVTNFVWCFASILYNPVEQILDKKMPFQNYSCFIIMYTNSHNELGSNIVRQVNNNDI